MKNERDLVSAISKLARMMRRRPKEEDNMTFMGNHILHIVMEHDGIRSTEIAKLADVRPASVTDALNRLEKNGLISRVKDEKDSRVRKVYITDKTKKEMEIRMNYKQKENEKMLSCLTEEEILVFLSVCDKLCAFLEQKEDDL